MKILLNRFILRLEGVYRSLNIPSIVFISLILISVVALSTLNRICRLHLPADELDPPLSMQKAWLCYETHLPSLVRLQFRSPGKYNHLFLP